MNLEHPFPFKRYRQNAKDLTPERVGVLQNLIRFHDEHSYPPSVRELAQRLKLRSHSTVHSHLEHLERQGLVERERRTIRGWRATGGGRQLAGLPYAADQAA
jgi:SOS-response transcriptional repressor LexA